MNIIVDDLCGAQIVQLLEEHLAHMHSTSPPGSVHALDLDSQKSSYEKHGFSACKPFADYVEDCNSAFYCLDLADACAR